MKKKSNPRKLSLKRQTLRNLDLEQVHGGLAKRVTTIDTQKDCSNNDSCIVMGTNCW